MKKNVFIVNGSSAYKALFLDLGYNIVDNIIEATLVCFTGGADVSPSMYGAKEHVLTSTNPVRDMKEQLVFENAREIGIPMVGICRGAQFLNVMSGGEMYQHVTNHVGSHYLVDNITGETVYVSSTHHQMMKPSGAGLLVGSSRLGGEREWYEGQVYHRDVSKEDSEVVYYGNTNCLCFQPHPEFDGGEYTEMRVYFNSLLNRYLVK